MTSPSDKHCVCVTLADYIKYQYKSGGNVVFSEREREVMDEALRKAFAPSHAVPIGTAEANTLNRDAYEKLCAENIAWLEKQPRTLERDHIIQIVRQSPEREYARSSTGATENPLREFVAAMAREYGPEAGDAARDAAQAFLLTTSAPSATLTMPSTAEIKLACGEMSAEETRTVRAVLAWFIRRADGGGA